MLSNLRERFCARESRNFIHTHAACAKQGLVVVSIRRATAADIERIHELISAIADYHEQAHYVRTDLDELRTAGFGEDPRFEVLLAEVGTEVVGFVSFTINYSIWLGQRFMLIDDVFVDAAHRGQNIGEALMFAARDRAKALGLGRVKWEVQTDNQAARRFYERLGARYYEKGVFAWDWTD